MCLEDFWAFDFMKPWRMVWDRMRGGGKEAEGARPVHGAARPVVDGGSGGWTVACMIARLGFCPRFAIEEMNLVVQAPKLFLLAPRVQSDYRPADRICADCRQRAHPGDQRMLEPVDRSVLACTAVLPMKHFWKSSKYLWKYNAIAPEWIRLRVWLLTALSCASGCWQRQLQPRCSSPQSKRDESTALIGSLCRRWQSTSLSRTNANEFFQRSFATNHAHQSWRQVRNRADDGI